MTEPTTKPKPVELFLHAMSSFMRLIKQDDHIGYFHRGDEFFIQFELVDTVSKLCSGLINYAVFIRSVWIPRHRRGQNRFHDNMTIVKEFADLYGVILFGIANPCEWSSDYSTIDDMREIFIKGRGFRYVPDYIEKKLRQRQRLRRLGFRCFPFGGIKDRDRIKKKDRLVYLPETLDQEVKIDILRARQGLRPLRQCAVLTPEQRAENFLSEHLSAADGPDEPFIVSSPPLDIARHTTPARASNFPEDWQIASDDLISLPIQQAFAPVVSARRAS